MTLSELLEAVRQGPGETRALFPLIPPSRLGPMKTSIKHYARCLGLDPTQARPEHYHRPESDMRELIEQKAPGHLSSTTIRNIKNDL
jgi:hypothetical protein